MLLKSTHQTVPNHRFYKKRHQSNLFDKNNLLLNCLYHPNHNNSSNLQLFIKNRKLLQNSMNHVKNWTSCSSAQKVRQLKHNFESSHSLLTSLTRMCFRWVIKWFVCSLFANFKSSHLFLLNLTGNFVKLWRRKNSIFIRLQQIISIFVIDWWFVVCVMQFTFLFLWLFICLCLVIFLKCLNLWRLIGKKMRFIKYGCKLLKA